VSVRPSDQGRRNDRITKVERRSLIGDAWRFEETLRDSEDSSKLNTSFVERLNLTIRQGSAYFFRRTIYTRDGRSLSKITWSCFAAATTSSGLTWC
jgi:IS1 family transposase